APVNLADSIRKIDRLLIESPQSDALLERIQHALRCEAWRLRFEVEGAAREYYVYRTAPPAAGKTVRLH
ncbi:MAG: hypothetical protein NZ843_06015, partial [Fimbriimonadales bacterium]|nr:hypothetical protein [Fimbriimonadales bacterium]